MYITPPKVLKKTPTKKFKEEMAILAQLTPHFENLSIIFDKNNYFHVPVRTGNFGQISELNFRLDSNIKQKVSYYGSISELDYLLFIK